MAAGSKIAVEIVGSSSELTAAAGKAAASLKDLGSVVTKETDAAVAAGGKSVRTNAQIAASYQETSRSVIAALQEQMAAVARASEELAAADGKQVVSARKALEAQTKAATATVRAQQQIMAANEKAAKSAQAAATQEAKASEEAAAASQRAASVHVSSAKRTEQAFGSASSGLTKAGKLITLGLVGAAVASVDLAVKFQANTLRMQTQAGATAKQLQLLRKGILDMAGSVGYTPNQLANALYHVVSSMNALLPASQRVSGELKVMRTAAQLAQVGHSDLEETTYALASAMNALHTPIADTTKLAGQMNAVVGSGDMTMTDLVETFKSGLLPGARQVGLSFQSVGAALAVMGDMGMRGALAGTRLRMSIALLSSPSEAAAKVLQTLGLSAREAMSTSQAMADALKKAGLRTTQLGADLRQPDGLMVALKDLNDHLQRSGLTASGAAAVMNKAFGGGRMGATITLLAQNTDRLNTKFHQIGDSANQFGADWQRQGQTTAQQLHNIEGGAIALGTRLGSDLLPMLETGIHDFTDFVKWVEHGGVVVHDLEIAIGTLATVAIGSYLVSNLMKAIKLFRELGQFVNNPLGVGQAVGRATAPTALGGAGAARPGLPGVGMLSGARGFQAPGSVANPIVVAMEAGEFAGLSSMGAAGTVSNEMGAAKAETGAVQAVTKGDVVLPAGVRSVGGPAAAEAAAAGGAVAQAEVYDRTLAQGILTPLKSGLNKALSGLMKGGLIAGGGLLASQLAGQAIGGKTGKDVSKVGTFTSVGAGLGSFLGPEGTLAGGVAGAIVGGMDIFVKRDAEKYGNKIADKITAPLGRDVAAQFHDGIARAANQARNLGNVAKQAVKPGTVIGPRFGGPRFSGAVPAAPSAAVAKEQADAFFNEGYLGAQATIKGLQSVKTPTTYVVSRDFLMQLQKLRAQSRTEGAKLMLEYAHSLEQSGKLPKGAVDSMIATIKNVFPGLQTYFQQQGLLSDATIAKALKFDAGKSSLTDFLSSVRQTYGMWTMDTKITGQNIWQNTATAMNQLDAVVSTTTGKTRTDAEGNLKALADGAEGYFKNMGSQVASSAGDMATAVSRGSQQAYQVGSQNFGNLQKSIGQAMSAGVISAQQGTKLILDALNAALKALGEQPIGLATLQAATPAQLQAVASGQVSSGGLASPHATGGLIQVGRPGERGHDRIPMNVGGVPIRVGAGEKVAVFNHQQQALAGRLIPGGLDGLFAATRGTRHDMAAGGYVDGFSGLTPERVDQGKDFGGAGPVGAIGPGVVLRNTIWPGWPGVGGIVYRLTGGARAGQDVYVMEDFQASAPVGAQLTPGQIIGRALGGSSGIEAGWANSSGTGPLTAYGGRADGTAMPGGVDFANFIAGLAAGKLIGGPGGLAALGAAALPTISAPGVSGKGVIPDLVRAGLGKIAAAANADLAGLAGGAGAAGTGALVPGIMGIEQQAAQVAGLPFVASIVAALLQHESAGGVNEPPSGPLQATGPNQVIPSTFAQYALPGHTNIDNPLDNAIASMRYIKSRYGTLAGMAAATGLLSGGYKGYSTGGYVDAAKGLPPAKAPAKPKPKQKSVKQTKAAKLPKLPNLKALPGFDTTLLGQIAAGDTSAQELSNWLGYLQSLHGGVAAQATLTDSSGNTVVNWGSQAGAIGQLTGMVDPATGQVTKGIYDRLREIGDPGSAPNQTATRDKSTELGADEQILDTLLSEQTLAAQAAAELGPWVANMQSTVGFESEAAGWLQNALDPAFPWDTISLKDLGKILTGRVKQLKPGKKFPGGPAMAGASLGGMSELVLGSQQHFTIPLAEYVMDMARQYKNMIAQAQHWTKLKEQVPQEKADRDYTIAQRFAAARHRISNASATSTFDATTLLREQEAGLHQEERSALARISTAKPSGWVGDAATWRAERARERTGIGDEFAARKLALEDNAAAAKLTGQLAKSDALAALSSEERYERYAVATHFRAETTKLHDLISGDATVESQDKKYLGSVLSSIQAENTADVASLTAATGAGGFQDQLAAYLDPMGQLSLSVLTKENIDIAGLLREIAALKGTKVQAATPSAGNTTLDSLLAQQNTTLAETLALNEAQTRVLAGMIPEIPHFEKGGPMLDDGLAYLHKGEHVVPRGGTLVSQGAAAPVNITIEHHHHSPADALGRFVDTRVQSPHNVRAVSTQIGRRTSMLSNRPGSRRTDRI